MTELLRGEQFTKFVLGYERDAFRLETREHYREAEEDEPLRRFLAGQPDYAWNQEWAAMIRHRTMRGQRMSRVRVVAEPHSDYTRFGIDLARVNVAAGEDIRYLPRPRAAVLDLPRHDFWLIDSHTVAILHFGDDDTLTGAEVRTDPAAVEQHRRWRTVAWAAAMPLAQYAG